MRRNRLIESQLSQSKSKMYQSMYDAMPEDEKISWKKAIQQCLDEFAGSKEERQQDTAREVRFSLIGGGVGVGFIVLGVKLRIIELCAMGAILLGWVTKFSYPEWEIIIDCAKKKKGMTTSNDTNSEMGVNESKKIIRLTESELVGLIRRIIKEDDNSESEIPVRFCQVKSLESLLKEAKQKQKLNFFPQRGYVVDTVEKGPNSMIMNKKITPGMSIKLTDPIKLEEGAEIFLEDITDFGQPQLGCKGSKPSLYISYGG